MHVVIKYDDDDDDDDSPHMYSQYLPMQSNRQDIKHSLSIIQTKDYGNSMGKRLLDGKIHISYEFHINITNKS